MSATVEPRPGLSPPPSDSCRLLLGIVSPTLPDPAPQTVAFSAWRNHTMMPLHNQFILARYGLALRTASAKAAAPKMSIRESSLIHGRRLDGRRGPSSSGNRSARIRARAYLVPLPSPRKIRLTWPAVERLHQNCAAGCGNTMWAFCSFCLEIPRLFRFPNFTILDDVADDLQLRQKQNNEPNSYHGRLSCCAVWSSQTNVIVSVCPQTATYFR